MVVKTEEEHVSIFGLIVIMSIRSREWDLQQSSSSRDELSCNLPSCVRFPVYSEIEYAIINTAQYLHLRQ